MTVENTVEPATAAHRDARRRPHRRRRRQGQGPARAGGSRRPARCASPCSPAAARACATSSSSTSAPSTATSSRDFDGVEVVVDRMSAPYLDGATIDFVDTIEKQGFTIDNPNAGGSCACGDSLPLIASSTDEAPAVPTGRPGPRPCDVVPDAAGRSTARGRCVAVQIAVTGSIATDHLMTFRASSPTRSSSSSSTSLAVLPRRRPRDPPRRRRRPTSPSAWASSACARSWSARSGDDFADYRSWLERHGVDCDSVHVSRDRAHRPLRLHHRRRHGPDRLLLRRAR